MNADVLAQMLAVLTPDVVEKLKRAVEIGKWPDGRALSADQRLTCMQAVIAWESKYLPEAERSGYIHKAHKEGEVCDDTPAAEKPIKFMH